MLALRLLPLWYCLLLARHAVSYSCTRLLQPVAAAGALMGNAAKCCW